MKKLKRALSIACALALTVTLFSACGKKSDESTQSSTTSTASEQENTSKSKNVDLRFAWWGTDIRHKATLAAIEAYMQKNSNVKIEAEYMGYDGYNKKLLTQLAGDTAPDVFQFHRDWLPDVQSQGDMLGDLEKFTQIDLKQFSDTLLKGSSTYKGKTYIVPTAVVGQTAIYNKDFFAKHGLTEESAWTWEKLLEVGKKVHENDKTAYLTTADIDVLNIVIFSPYVSQKTGSSWINEDYTINVTKADLTDGLKFVSDLYASGAIEPFGEGSVFTGKMEQNPKWINGEIGMLFDVTNAVSKYKASIPNAKIGVTALPVRSGAKISGVDYSGNVGLSINNRSKNIEEAAKFANWFVNDKDAAVILTDVRGVPASETALKALTDANKLDADLAKSLEIASKNNYTINMVSSNNEIMQIRKDVLQKLIFGKITPEQGAEEILKGFETKLKEMKANAK